MLVALRMLIASSASCLYNSTCQLQMSESSEVKEALLRHIYIARRSPVQSHVERDW